VGALVAFAEINSEKREIPLGALVEFVEMQARWSTRQKRDTFGGFGPFGQRDKREIPLGALWHLQKCRPVWSTRQKRDVFPSNSSGMLNMSIPDNSGQHLVLKMAAPFFFSGCSARRHGSAATGGGDAGAWLVGWLIDPFERELLISVRLLLYASNSSIDHNAMDWLIFVRCVLAGRELLISFRLMLLAECASNSSQTQRDGLIDFC
jgi:hypothetical protein